MMISRMVPTASLASLALSLAYFCLNSVKAVLGDSCLKNGGSKCSASFTNVYLRGKILGAMEREIRQDGSDGRDRRCGPKLVGHARILPLIRTAHRTV